MKAIEEIGAEPILRYSLFVPLQIIFGILYFPPVKALFLKLLGAKVKKNSIIMNVKFFNWHYSGPSGFKVGEDCFIGDETLIDLYDGVILENQVTISPRTTILTHINVGYHDHPLQKYFPKSSKPVAIKRGSFIGAGSIILPGITIGEKSFVAAGSVVTKNVTGGSLVAGVPAKFIRKIGK